MRILGFLSKSLIFTTTVISLSAFALQDGTRVRCFLNVTKETPVGQLSPTLMDGNPNAGASPNIDFTVYPFVENGKDSNVWSMGEASKTDSESNIWTVRAEIIKINPLQRRISVHVKRPSLKPVFSFGAFDTDFEYKVPSRITGMMPRNLNFELRCSEQ